jgi:hypothetical protein
MTRTFLIFIFSILFASSACAAFPVGWSGRCPITVQHAQVAGDQADFPVLVSYRVTANNEMNLPDEMMQTGNPNAAQSDGGDIRFTLDQAGTQPLHYEIVKFTQNAVLANAIAEIWVKLPNIYTSKDVTFYVWYKASSAQTTPAANDAAWGSQGVWAASFDGVWHLKEAPTGAVGDFKDSTSSGYNSTDTANQPAQTTGKIDGGLSFSTKYITAGAVGNYTASPFTFSLWVNPTAVDWVNGSIVFYKGGWQSSGYYAYFANGALGGGAKCVGISFNQAGANQRVETTANSITTGVWQYVVITRSGAVGKIYVNGVDVTGNTQSIVNPVSSASEFMIGKYSSPDYPYIGVLDEVRAASAARSFTWVSTEYNNQNAPQTFLARGSVEGMQASLAGIGSITGVSSITY